MTDVPVENNSPLVTITAIGGQTAFTFTFLIQAADQLQVIQTPLVSNPGGPPVTLILDTDFTIPVTAINDNDGGDITLTAASFPTGATAGDLFTLSREIPIERLTDFPFRGVFDADTVNFQFDTVFLILQEQERDISRAMTLDIADSLTSITIPLDRANRFAAYDATGQAIASAGSPPATVPVSVYGESLVSALDADAAQLVLELDVGSRNLETTLVSQVFC